MRSFARAFCEALTLHDPNRIADWLDDTIDWTVYGPVDLFPFFGQRRSKPAVLAMMTAIDGVLALKSCDYECTLTDGEQAASLLKLNARHRRSGRMLSLRMAMFAKLEAGKLARLRAVFDTFDAAEQALGREIDLSDAA